MPSKLKMSLLAGIGAVGLALSSAAHADIIPLDTFVTGSGFGSTAPTGTIEITDLGQEVQFDFDISEGDLAALFFNLIEPFDFADLSLRNLDTAPGDPGATLTNMPSAPSGLSFDFGVDLGRGSAPGNQVRSGTFVLALEGVDLSPGSFSQTSTNSAGLEITAGAKIQSLGPNGGGSATIGGNPGGSSGSSGGTPVPAPAALGLFLPAVALLLSKRRRARS